MQSARVYPDVAKCVASWSCHFFQPEILTKRQNEIVRWPKSRSTLQRNNASLLQSIQYGVVSDISKLMPLKN